MSKYNGLKIHEIVVYLLLILTGCDNTDSPKNDVATSFLDSNNTSSVNSIGSESLSSTHNVGSTQSASSSSMQSSSIQHSDNVSTSQSSSSLSYSSDIPYNMLSEEDYKQLSYNCENAREFPGVKGVVKSNYFNDIAVDCKGDPLTDKYILLKDIYPVIVSSAVVNLYLKYESDGKKVLLTSVNDSKALTSRWKGIYKDKVVDCIYKYKETYFPINITEAIEAEESIRIWDNFSVIVQFGVVQWGYYAYTHAKGVSLNGNECTEDYMEDIREGNITIDKYFELIFHVEAELSDGSKHIFYSGVKSERF